MTKVWAIARLAFWEGMRMRVVLVFLLLLVIVVLRLPFALRGDETLAGRLQTFLDYSIGALSVLMGLATVFFSCMTLTNEFKTQTLHLVVTKPVTRFEIIAGKWLGVNLLNILLVALCGTAIYGLASFIKNRPATFDRDKLNVRDIIWTARAAAAPVRPDFRKEAEEYVEQRVKDGVVENVPDKKVLAMRERIKEMDVRWRRIPPAEYSVYHFEDLLPPEHADEVIQIRFKARGVPIPKQEVLFVDWAFVDPDSGQMLMEPRRTQERSGDVHQFLVQARAFHNGKAALFIGNPYTPDDRVAILFEGEDSLQILYKVGGFELNYLKTLLIILFRLAFISAVGVMFSSFATFPVACLGALAVYIIGLIKPWWMESIGANMEIGQGVANIDPFGTYGPAIRTLLVPILSVLFPDFVKLDGTGKLVDGLHIANSLVGQAAIQTLAFGAALVLGLGWLVFRRREVAEVIVQ